MTTPLDNGVYGLIRDLGGIVRNSYTYSNTITITMDIPEEAIPKLSSDPRVSAVRSADKLTIVIEFQPSLDEGVKGLILSMDGNLTGTYLSNEGIIEAELPEEAIGKLSSDPRITNVRPAIWGRVYQDELVWGVDRIDTERVWGGAEDATDIVTGRNAGEGIKVAIYY